jgi:hypothetical protein
VHGQRECLNLYKGQPVSIPWGPNSFEQPLACQNKFDSQ